ncbi:MAG: ribbon-helix-helix protein, CopG family [Acidimicrobiia bacterium]
MPADRPERIGVLVHVDSDDLARLDARIAPRTRNEHIRRAIRAYLAALDRAELPPAPRPTPAAAAHPFAA